MEKAKSEQELRVDHNKYDILKIDFKHSSINASENIDQIKRIQSKIDQVNLCICVSIQFPHIHFADMIN